MKRVLMISPLPWNIGGVEKRITEIARNLDEEIELVILASSDRKEEIGEYDWNGVKVVVLEKTPFFPNYPRGLYSYLRDHRDSFDLIDLQGLKTIEPVIYLLSGVKKPLILTPHHHARASNRLLQLLKTFYDPMVSKPLLDRARLVICVSDIEKKLIMDEFGQHLQGKMAVISNGINVGDIQSSEPFDIECNVVLYVGRLERYKNVQNVIDAMEHLPDSYRLYIIGDGSYRKALEKLTDDKRLVNRVTFLGRISEADLYRWLRTSKVFVNLSDLEAFGISVIEAIAAGASAVVNNRYGLAEIAEKFPAAVYPVDVKDISPQALADTIKRASPAREVNLLPYDWPCIAAEVNKKYLAYS